MKQAIRSLIAGCICMLGAFTANAQFVNVGTLSNRGILSITTDFDNNAGATFTTTLNPVSVAGNLNQSGTTFSINFGSTLTVNGNITCFLGATTTNGSTLSVGGNIDLQSGTTFNTSAGTLRFVGANSQTLTNSTGADLTTSSFSVTKNGGSVTLAGGRRLDVIGGSFTLTPTVSMPINYNTTTDVIRLGQTVNPITGGLGYINGPLERIGNGLNPHDFPLGTSTDGGGIRYVALGNVSLGSIIRVSVGLGGAPTGVSGFTPRTTRFYSIQVISGTGVPGGASLTLPYTNASGDPDNFSTPASVSVGRSDANSDGPFVSSGTGGVGAPTGTITTVILSVSTGNTAYFRLGVSLALADIPTISVALTSCEFDRPIMTVTYGTTVGVASYTLQRNTGSSFVNVAGYTSLPTSQNTLILPPTTTTEEYRILSNNDGTRADNNTAPVTITFNATTTIRLDVRVFLQAVYNPSLATDPMRSSQLTPGQLQLAYSDYPVGSLTPAGVYPRNTVGGTGPFSNVQERLFVPVKDRIYDTTVGDTSTIRVPPRVGLTLFPVDVVMIGLRSAGADFNNTAEDTLTGNFKYAWVMTDGSIREFRLGNSGPNYVTFCAPGTGNYHVIVRHRNHLPIASNATTLTANGIVQTVDLTVRSNVYEMPDVQDGGFIHSNNRVSMFRGKVAERVRVPPIARYVNAYDFFTVFTNPTGARGIYSADINFDGRVDSGDYVGIQNSIDNLFFSTVPVW